MLRSTSFNPANLPITGGTISGITAFSMASGVGSFAAGTINAPSLTLSDTTIGWYRNAANQWAWTNGTAATARFLNGGFDLGMSSNLSWSSNDTATGTIDTILARDAANTIAQKNAGTAQAFRVYGTTTGPKYLSLSHDGTDGRVDTAASSGKLILGGNASDIQWGKALVALGGGAAPTVGTIGGSGPATAAQNTWLRILDSSGTAAFIPVWK